MLILLLSEVIEKECNQKIFMRIVDECKDGGFYVWMVG
ncbi:hypothetical protein PF1202 [Pyrococcus furiosus DSM 3638]|uniref:Uncharacterized protein n=1 Tax=Pyrococcus furiosus (strain ATCC 43587 / DSM 3638 / JCM 8422 / Vc1) TaxID=186497 RepID=Q8U1K4_PYRFU|nr:hypothetical protein PF1202 [Pyrococcus furiosus DSM 3638]